MGLVGLFADFSSTYWLKESLAVNKFIANSMGFLIAASSNYYFNRVWTFESHNEKVPQEYLSFMLVSLVGLIINNGVLYLFNQHLKLPFYFSKLSSTAVTVVWNFMANYFFTFQSL